MASGLAAIGIMALVAASAAVGMRLLSLARRTRKLPELALGLSFVCFGMIGYPVAVVARQKLGAPVVAGYVFAWALVIQNIGCLAVYVFTWRVFRPDRRWALVLTAMAAGALLVGQIGQWLTIGFYGGRDGGLWYYVGMAARALGFAWAAIESFRYYLMMRRRLRLGLGDAVVAHRLRWWGTAASSITLGFGVFLWGRLTYAEPVKELPILLATTAVGVVAGLSTWLAFFPRRSHS